MYPTLLVSSSDVEQSHSPGPTDLEGLGSKPTSGPASMLQKWPFILQQGQNINADTNITKSRNTKNEKLKPEQQIWQHPELSANRWWHMWAMKMCGCLPLCQRWQRTWCRAGIVQQLLQMPWNLEGEKGNEEDISQTAGHTDQPRRHWKRTNTNYWKLHQVPCVSSTLTKKDDFMCRNVAIHYLRCTEMVCPLTLVTPVIPMI